MKRHCAGKGGKSQCSCCKWHWCSCQLTGPNELKMILLFPALDALFQKLILLLAQNCYPKTPGTPNFIWRHGASGPLNIRLKKSQAEQPNICGCLKNDAYTHFFMHNLTPKLNNISCPSCFLKPNEVRKWVLWAVSVTTAVLSFAL